MGIEGITVISQWREPNNEKPFDEETYLDGLEDYVKEFSAKTEDALNELK